jgi:deoxyribodipyrimidine photo-lyase
MSTALVWLRRDLRLHDNPALYHAVLHQRQLIPVFIYAPQEEAPWPPGAASRWWLHGSLTALGAVLSASGSRLLVRSGDSLRELRRLIQETGAQAVYWNRLYEPPIIARDRGIEAALREAGLETRSFSAAVLIEPWTLARPDGQPYQVFSPFWKTCLQQLPPAPPLPRPRFFPAPPVWPDSVPLASLGLLPRVAWYGGLAAAWQPGEAAAHARLAQFCERILPDYANTRDIPGKDGVSRLSPYLHWGELSPRQIWSAVSEATAGMPLSCPSAEVYLRELGWREFAHYVLYHWPYTPEKPLQERFAAYPWRTDYDVLLRAWQQGHTGYPLVDAGMRELWHSGWLHNRVRMIAASFLAKNCRIPWQEGARWFWDTLVDADLANNTLGWQWTAGCGTDAAPYFRVFNPLRQGERFDADGSYVSRWIPELAPLAPNRVHRPWSVAAEEQRRIGFVPGRDYPLPVLDFAASRSEALAGYGRIKKV